MLKKAVVVVTAIIGAALFASRDAVCSAEDCYSDAYKARPTEGQWAGDLELVMEVGEPFYWTHSQTGEFKFDLTGAVTEGSERRMIGSATMRVRMEGSSSSDDVLRYLSARTTQDVALPIETTAQADGGFPAIRLRSYDGIVNGSVVSQGIDARGTTTVTIDTAPNDLTVAMTTPNGSLRPTTVPVRPPALQNATVDALIVTRTSCGELSGVLNPAVFARM